MNIDELVNKLDHALQIAIKDRKPAARIKATMSKAKLQELGSQQVTA